MTEPDFPGDLIAYETGIPSGLYMYYIDSSDFKSGLQPGQAEEVYMIPPVSAVSSVVVVPYCVASDFNTREVEFDSKRFPMGDVVLPKNNMKRIIKQNIEEATLGSINIYNTSKNVGGARNWKNESKLYNFPFTYGMLYDRISEPIEFKYHLCKNTSNRCDVRVNKPLTNYGTYSLYLKGYKNDNTGILESTISTSSNQIPTISSAYADFMSYNKASMSAQRTGSIINGIVGVGSSLVTGNTISAIGGLASSMTQINSLNAQVRDLKDSPNVLNSPGSPDLLFSLRSKQPKGLYHYRLKLIDEEMQRIGDYFAMYGYKQNKIMRPNIRSRYYYNFIKTVGCTINSRGVPKEHLAKIQQIYNNGITTWHIDNNGVVVGDYSKDNREV